MKPIIFDGYKTAFIKEELLAQQVINLKQKNIFPKIAAILFREDDGSRLYTEKKREAAKRVGIDYRVFEFSMLDNVEKVKKVISQLNSDVTITGIIIQKPWRKTWLKIKNVSEAEKNQFQDWWTSLVKEIDENKDVDGLHPKTIEMIKVNTWQSHHKVLPATCRAVLEILEKNSKLEKIKKVIIVGKSDLLGNPLYFQLKNQEVAVQLLGRKDLEDRVKRGRDLLDADVIVSATGVANLIKGKMVKQGVVIIDAGEPQGDVEFATVSQKVNFITPVPGGVGPMTVVCLLENCLDLANCML